MRIYIAHPTSLDYENNIYIPLRSDSFLNQHELILPHESSGNIHSSREDYKNVDLVIAECSQPSTGMGIELGWKGCMDEESRKICVNTASYPVFDKTTYSAYNDELASFLKQNDIGKIYLCGVDADCRVLVTAMNLFENGYDVYVLEEYACSTQGEVAKNHAFDILKRNIGAERLIGKRPEVSNSPA